MEIILPKSMPNKTGYVEGVFDLFHIGHLRLLKRSKQVFGKVVAGVHSDETTAAYKSEPVIPYEHRLEIISACKYVDEVIEAPNLGIPTFDTIKFLNRNKLDYVVHGKTSEETLQKHFSEIIKHNRLYLMEETEMYHTQDLIKKCQEKVK